MGERDADSTNTPQREQTDESLRLERDKADARVAAKRETVEDATDEVVRIARQRADEIVQSTRDDADREVPSPTATEGCSDRERDRVDAILEQERSTADAILERERAERGRYLADFLAVEREATDQDLIGERVHADSLIAARDEFLATVSHDLRSLLGSLSLNAEILVQHAPDGEVGDKMRKHAATSQRLVARMNRLLNDLLDVASIDRGKLAIVPERTEIAKLLRDTLDAFGPIAAAKKILLHTEGEARPTHALIDSGRILQVLANLVSNAIKFTSAGGEVSIRVHSDDNELHFAVSDSGIGIPEDALEAVFERFRQVSRDRRGLGLGLHISKSIVEAHGGRMWVESKLAVGSTFHFALPVRER